MNLEVISDDHSLLAICREIAGEFPQVEWKLGGQTHFAENCDADLRLWDYKRGACPPERIRWGSKCFALVSSGDLDGFRAAHPYAEAGIVLKPVTRAVLRALLAQALTRSAPTSEFEDASLRSDRDEILQCLMQANLQLQQYDAERTNFLGRALHDFHAPLTALSGYCGLLLDDKTGSLSEQQKIIIDRMQHSVRRLSRMSSAMFQLSIGRHVTLKPALREGDVRECAEQALYEIQQFVQEKDLQLDIDFEPSGVPLLIDSGQIEQVLINLLENACKFSARSGSIIIKGYSCFCERRATNVLYPADSDRRAADTRTSNAYRVDIVDSGPGIPPDHLKSIFEEYVSYSGGQDRSRGGLGLAICRMILNQHQGRIWAENCESGAVFSFILPLQHAADGHDAAPIVYTGSARESLAACV